MVRSMHCDQFNHLPGQLLMLTGTPFRGWPTLGSWLNYGLGSASRDLPGYVVMTTLGRGLPGGAASWSSGFLPSNYSGALFRNEGSDSGIAWPSSSLSFGLGSNRSIWLGPPSMNR